MYQLCRVAVHLLLRHKDQILFSRRFNTGYADGKLSVPAGHVDDNEPPVAAMLREAKEEVNLKLPMSSLTLVHTMHRLTDVGPWINLFFECSWHTDMGQPINAEPHKCSELIWASDKNVPSDTVDYLRVALDFIREGCIYSELNY